MYQGIDAAGTGRDLDEIITYLRTLVADQPAGEALARRAVVRLRRSIDSAIRRVLTSIVTPQLLAVTDPGQHLDLTRVPQESARFGRGRR